MSKKLIFVVEISKSNLIDVCLLLTSLRFSKNVYLDEFQTFNNLPVCNN